MKWEQLEGKKGIALDGSGSLEEGESICHGNRSEATDSKFVLAIRKRWKIDKSADWNYGVISISPWMGTLLRVLNWRRNHSEHAWRTPRILWGYCEPQINHKMNIYVLFGLGAWNPIPSSHISIEIHCGTEQGKTNYNLNQYFMGHQILRMPTLIN